MDPRGRAKGGRQSSKYVTESAFVQSPILPAALNVSSVASIFLLPS
jgi:hypothetical protein